MVASQRISNWSKNISWTPAEIHYPKTESEIQNLVKQASKNNTKIRIIGTGHSFTPVCKTDDILVSLDKYQGMISVDKEKCQATVKGGTKLHLLGKLLFEQGMAMVNLGDIDAQSIAGTISTGTHGTGSEFGTISTQVVAVSLINGHGEKVTCSTEHHPELLKAAQLSLGMLGVITSITLQCVPSYMLLIENRCEPLSEVLDNLTSRLQKNRNFEYYWIPHTSSAWTKTTNIVKDAVPDKMNMFHYWTEYIVENYSYKVLCEYARHRPSQNKMVAELMAANIKDLVKTDYSHNVYATKRLVRFREMEYNVPAEAYHDVFNEIKQAVDQHKFDIHFPVENRWVKKDDLYLSPSYGRDSAYIAVHVYNKKAYEDYFKVVEAICRAYGGRPHWGKMHTLSSEDVRELYPKLEDFLAFRQEHDPHRIFLNDYLENLFVV